MTEEHALLAAILAEPGDDTARLVYADWLDERGGRKRAARAELIRAQIEAARNYAITEHWVRTPSTEPGGTAEDGGAAGAALATAQIAGARASALLKKWGAGWVPREGRVNAGVAQFKVEPGDTLVTGGFGLYWGYRFVRGFVGEVAMEVEGVGPGRFEQFTEALANLYRVCPVRLLRVGVFGRAPTVLVHTGPEVLPEGGVGGDWRLLVRAGDVEAGEEPVDVLHVVYQTREAFLAHAVREIVGQLDAIDFEPFRDDDDGGFDPEDFGDAQAIDGDFIP